MPFFSTHTDTGAGSATKTIVAVDSTVIASVAVVAVAVVRHCGIEKGRVQKGRQGGPGSRAAPRCPMT